MIPKNLELAREMIMHLISEMHTLYVENAHIEAFLHDGDEYELIVLPGECLKATLGSLRAALKLACQPVSMPQDGRERAIYCARVIHQRQNIRLFVQVAIALLQADGAGDLQVGTNSGCDQDSTVSMATGEAS